MSDAARWSMSGWKATVFFVPSATSVQSTLADFTTAFSTSASSDK